MNIDERIAEYNRAFPKFQKLYNAGNRIEGVWFLGNDYKNTTRYYGAYPPQYLKRMGALFGDAKDVLHLFAGSLPASDNYKRVDINPLYGDITDDAHTLASIPNESFDLIYADPPYSIEDAEHYGTPMIKRKHVMQACWRVLKPNGWLVWLDQALPIFAKRAWHLGMAIGIVRSTNHRVRFAFGFQKVRSNET
jgi:SAM-dependent methyltransferase